MSAYERVTSKPATRTLYNMAATVYMNDIDV